MRIRPLLPILLSTIAVPAVAADHTHCATASDFVACLINEDAIQRQRDAEINAAIARVERASQRDLSTTHCKTPDSQTPRCLAEREHDFATRQNALAAASMALAAEVRARQAARAAENAAVMARARAEESRRLEMQQNALIEISLRAFDVERQRRLAVQQNALATASMQNVANERRRQLMARLAPCVAANDMREKCLIQRGREFAATQKALATASMQNVAAERARSFAAERNAEINASLAAVERNRAAERAVAYNLATSHCARNASTPRCAAEQKREFLASVTHCKSAADTSPRCEAERARDFRVARNNEVDRSIAAVAAARARGLLDTAAAATQPRSSSIETGAIGVPQLPKTPALEVERRGSRFHDISDDPCRVGLFDPVQFTRGGRIESDARPELDRLAKLVETCPGMRVEVHGYSDGASRANNTYLSQQRAQAIADYLIASGVAPNRVAAIGRGGRHPVLPYAKAYEAPLGSRAELIVRDPSMDAAARRVMWDLAEVLDPTYIPAVANLSP